MEPGKSVVYACLEVCLCVLVRHLPALNPAIPQTGFQPLTKECGFTPDVNTLISSCVTVIGQLFNLCSPKGNNGGAVFRGVNSLRNCVKIVQCVP